MVSATDFQYLIHLWQHFSFGEIHKIPRLYIQNKCSFLWHTILCKIQNHFYIVSICECVFIECICAWCRECSCYREHLRVRGWLCGAGSPSFLYMGSGDQTEVSTHASKHIYTNHLDSLTIMFLMLI